MFYSAYKLTIVTEKLITKGICKIIEKAGARGYTLVPAGGRGLHHFHATDSQATMVDDFTELQIEVIVKDRAIAERITDQVMQEYFQDYAGILYLEPVEVLRPSRF